MLRYGLALFFGLLSLSALAEEMPAGTEQFYVTQGLFNDLNISQTACVQEDDVIHFACGRYEGPASQFQLDVDVHVAENLPGLKVAGEWFNNAGTTLVRSYQSAQGTYLFAYNAGGEITIVFTPF